MKQCDNGHYFDENRFGSCPYCTGGVGKTISVTPAAPAAPAFPGAPAAPAAPAASSSAPTAHAAPAASSAPTAHAAPAPAPVPAPAPAANAAPTVPAAPAAPTVPAAPSAPAPAGGDMGKTVAIIKNDNGIDPPVGFLVCVEGVHRGMSYRLVSGRNYIGRSSTMDIALPEDKSVSRDTHSVVAYDAKSNTFKVAAGQGRGITYLNGDTVEVSETLKAYDIIEVGESKLIFLPLCGEKFTWTNNEDR